MTTDSIRARNTDNEKTIENIRQRTVEEDNLLGSRTSAFLIGNGFVLTALGTNPEPSFKLIIALFGLVVGIFWLLTTMQSYRAIQALHKYRMNKPLHDEINDAVTAALFKTIKPLRPTACIALWLPIMVLVLWSIIAALMLDSCVW